MPLKICSHAQRGNFGRFEIQQFWPRFKGAANIGSVAQFSPFLLMMIGTQTQTHKHTKEEVNIKGNNTTKCWSKTLSLSFENIEKQIFWSDFDATAAELVGQESSGEKQQRLFFKFSAQIPRCNRRFYKINISLTIWQDQIIMKIYNSIKGQCEI